MNDRHHVTFDRVQKMAIGDLRVVAIDPGDVHVGWASFIGGHCNDAREVAPYECIAKVRWLLEADAIDVICVETFRLFENKMREQIGSEFQTVELIGALRYVWADWNDRGGGSVEWHQYPPDDKKITAGHLRALKVWSKAKELKVGGHAYDAELQGYRHLLEKRGMKWAS